jgi:hypothetical protein
MLMSDIKGRVNAYAARPSVFKENREHSEWSTSRDKEKGHSYRLTVQLIRGFRCSSELY